jgi:hypothetical protein
MDVAMTCVILRPDPQKLFDSIKSMFASTVLGGGNVVPESNEWYVVSNDYAMTESFFAIADQMWREANPETACCDNLLAMAAQRGVFPKPAAYATGYVTLTGSPGSPVPPAFEVSTDLGIYVAVGTIPLSIPIAGTVNVRVRALQPGPEMNADGSKPIPGVLTTTAPGINPDVIICGDRFCGGTNAETCEELRKRFLNRLAYQPRATLAWVRDKILEYPCVTRVCIREGSCFDDCVSGCENCGDRMEFYVFFDGTFPCGIPPQYVIDEINIWLFGAHQGYGEGEVEIGICGKIYRPIGIEVDVVIDIVGCPTTAQKQVITDQIRALFLRVCPSMPLRAKQIELIAAAVIGVEINTAARFNLVNHSDNIYFEFSPCDDLLPKCDVMPCLRNIVFTGPDAAVPPCS